MELSIEQFNPAAAELSLLVAESSSVCVTDFTDKPLLAFVKEKRILLKKARVSIEKRGKELREEANAFSKAVIAKQNELIAIIEPEEIRLSQIEDSAEQYAIMEERKRKLPERKERCYAVFTVEEGPAPEYLDAQLLGMDDVAFETFLNKEIAFKLECETKRVQEEQARIAAEQAKKQAELDAKEAKLKEAELKVKREKELEVAKEQARKDGERYAREEQVRRELDERLQKEKEEAEIAKETAKLEKTKKYQAFLKAVGWESATADGDMLRTETPTEVFIWKKIGTFKKI